MARRQALPSGVVPVVGPGAVVLLAKALPTPTESAVRTLGVAQPAGLAGAVVAALALSPGGAAAIRDGGRTTVLHGAVPLVILAVFADLLVAPCSLSASTRWERAIAARASETASRGNEAVGPPLWSARSDQEPRR